MYDYLCPCHVVAPAILQSLIEPLCSPLGCCVVLAVSECNTAKCSFSAVYPLWEAFDQLRCCVCFRVSLLACSAPWLSGVLNELKPGFLQIVFSRIRRRVHDTLFRVIFISVSTSIGTEKSRHSTGRYTRLEGEVAPNCLGNDGECEKWWWISSVYLCIPTKHKILYQEYRDRKRRP